MNELEFVLNKIINIDAKATQVKKDTAETITKEEQELNKQLKTLESTCLSDSISGMDEQYTKAMEQARSEAKEIGENAEKEYKEIIERFNMVKDGLKNEIVKEIIKI